MANSENELCEIKRRIRKEIGLSIGFERLREKLDQWGEDREEIASAQEWKKEGLIESSPELWKREMGRKNRRFRQIKGGSRESRVGAW